MKFGDRVLYEGDGDRVLGVYLHEVNSKEAIVKVDNSREKVIVMKKYLSFIKDMESMDLIQAMVIADYISKEKYDGHYTLMAFTTGCRFCFGTLDKINYNTTKNNSKSNLKEQKPQEKTPFYANAQKKRRKSK